MILHDSDIKDLWADNVTGENLRIFRSFLNLSQKEFIDKYFTNPDGSRLISISKLSMAENGVLAHIEPILEQISQKTFIPIEQFEMPPEQFRKYLFRFSSETASNGTKKDPQVPIQGSEKADIKTAVRMLSDYLNSGLLYGRLKPGDKLPTVQQMAEQFGLKKPLVREAVQVLNVLGVLEARQGNGIYMTATATDFYMLPLSWKLLLNSKDSEDIMHLRFLLDGEAARLASQNASSEGLQAIKSVFQRMEAAYQEVDLAAYLDLDMEFHMAIARSCGNRTIESMISTLHSLMRSFSAGGMVFKKDIVESHQEHLKIWNYILSHDGENARKAIEEHRDSAIRRFKRNQKAGFTYTLS